MPLFVAEYMRVLENCFGRSKNFAESMRILGVFSSDNGPEITGKNKITEDNSQDQVWETYYSVRGNWRTKRS